MSDFVIFRTAHIIGEAGLILSRMRRTGSAGMSTDRVLDKINPLAQLAAERCALWFLVAVTESSNPADCVEGLQWAVAGACFGDFIGILAQDSGCDDASVVRMVQ
jgi:hypothetical protein